MILLLILIGLLLWFVGSLVFLFSAFTVSIWWGLFCIFFPPTNLLFLLLNWKVAKRGFFVVLAGWLLILYSVYQLDNDDLFVPNQKMINMHPFKVIDPNTADSLPVLPEGKDKSI